jgi:hypothetical protein
MEFASCQLCGAYNFEVATRFRGKCANSCVITIRMAFLIYLHATNSKTSEESAAFILRYNNTGLQ